MWLRALPSRGQAVSPTFRAWRLCAGRVIPLHLTLLPHFSAKHQGCHGQPIFYFQKNGSTASDKFFCPSIHPLSAFRKKYAVYRKSERPLSTLVWGNERPFQRLGSQRRPRIAALPILQASNVWFNIPGGAHQKVDRIACDRSQFLSRIALFYARP